jgi:hypothetical protein
METFIYQDLKTASRFKDKTKIMTLGPYAACLCYILSNNANKNTPLIVYRGICMKKELF